MAIIVEHLDSGNEYVLIAAHSGIDLNASARLLKSWLPDRVALCDRQGKIFWANASSVVVIEVDGQKLTEVLPEEHIPVPPAPDPEAIEVSSQAEDLGELGEDEEWL